MRFRRSRRLTTGAQEGDRPRSLASRLPLPVVVLAVSLVVGVGVAGAEHVAPWPVFHGGPTHQGVAPPSAPSPPLRQAWAVEVDRGVGALSAPVHDGHTAVAVGRDRVVAFDVSTGVPAWSRRREPGLLTVPAIAEVAGDSAVVVPEGRRRADAGLLALDLASGETLWRLPLTAPASGGPVVDAGTLFLSMGPGTVLAVDPAEGEVRWRARVGGTVSASPAVATGRVFVVSEERALGRMHLTAFDARSGRRLWSFSPPGPGLGTGAPTVVGRRVVVGFGDQTVRAIDAETGREGWAAPVRGPFAPGTALAADGGGVYASDYRGSLYRLDIGTGERAWDHQFAAPQGSSAPLVVANAVMLGLSDGQLVGVDNASGDLIWRRDIGSRRVGTPVPAGELLLVPSGAPTAPIVALEHDPRGRLVRVESPTRLHLDEAVLNFALAAVLVSALVGAAARFLPAVPAALGSGSASGAGAPSGPAGRARPGRRRKDSPG